MASQSLIANSDNPDTTDRNNNFYDNIETHSLTGGEIELTGELENSGKTDFTALPKRSVIVKETLLNEDGTNSFVGAYRYDGYSLFDILTERYPNKKNKEEFPPVIDLYAEITNDRGDTVLLSWGEIFYPTVLNRILIATDVARIVPSKTNELWPLPTERKLVVASDLITDRNISNPVKITIKSWDEKIPVNRDISPFYSPGITFSTGNETFLTLESQPEVFQEETFHTIFYGKGRGIHSTEPFTGVYLKELLISHVPLSRKSLQQSLVLVIGADGYRSVFSLSEIMNRNDQAEVLLITGKRDEEGGLFRIFAAGDFFSDRAVKAISEIQVR
ncbi:MAG: hypothetical protein JXA23_04080 [Bacteroidales bacterium]|nr:hypothetical protein [Bacteroidales bacterium]